MAALVMIVPILHSYRFYNVLLVCHECLLCTFRDKMTRLETSTLISAAGLLCCLLNIMIYSRCLLAL